MIPFRIDIEHSKVIFREIGLIISLSLVLVAFNLKSYERKESGMISRLLDETPEEFVEITQHEKPLPPPESPRQTTLISIVENELEVQEDLLINVEADQSTVVEEYHAEIPVDAEEEETTEEEPIFAIVESMPAFPGGEEARLKYLNDHVNYPTMAREAGIQGRVFVEFVIEKDGSVTNARVVRGIGGGCDEEAVRVVENMPRWIPGKQRNVPVRVRFNMPIRFILL
jgi:protein TonB